MTTLNPLHLEHLKRCLNRLSVAMLNADQPGVTRLAEQPPPLQQALTRLQRGLDATGAVGAIDAWSQEPTTAVPPVEKLTDVAAHADVDREPIAAETSTPTVEQPAVEATPTPEPVPDEPVVAATPTSSPPPASESPAPAAAQTDTYEEFNAESVEVALPSESASEASAVAGENAAAPPLAMAAVIEPTGAVVALRSQPAGGFFQAMPWRGGEGPVQAIARIGTPTEDPARFPVLTDKNPQTATAFFRAMPWAGQALAAPEREGFSIRPGSEVFQLPLHRESAGCNPILAATASALDQARREGGASPMSTTGSAGGFFRQLPWGGRSSAAS